MLETYITPLLMSYVDKYIKNLKPSDLSLSIWGGDVVLYNLELRLDVLEKELNLPITFLSGKIHKLQIHVPWTKLVSEPVEITITTIECIIQLKDPSFEKQADTSSHLTASEVKKELDKENLQDRGESPPAGYVQSLVNRVANNISLCVHNVILKYVEDDIVLSLNVKSAETFSVNSDWRKAFVDIVSPEYILRKVCNISDLTICLDKKSTSGGIDMYQDPLLFKCGLSCRVNMNYDAHLRLKGIKLNVYCESFDLSLTNEQVPLFVRLLKLCISMYYGTLDLPGCDYKPHPAAKMIEDTKNTQTRKSSFSSLEQRDDKVDIATSQSAAVLQDDWMNWVWSFIPEDPTDESTEEIKLITPDVQVDIGLYISQVSFTVKLTHKVSESTFFGAKRFQFRPLLSCEMSGVAVEIILKGEEFFDAQVGVTAIMGWMIGDCACYHGNDVDIKSIEEENELDDKEEEFLTVGAPDDSPAEPQGFLIGSLFYDNKDASLKIPELVYDAEEFMEQHSESYALQRYGAFFFDYLYTMVIEPDKEDITEGSDSVGMENMGEIKLVHEVSHKRIILGQVHLQLTTGLLHRMVKIYEFSTDNAPERKVKDAPFYDEFVEKQLLAGNIPSRFFTITMVSVKLTVPPSDHVDANIVLQSRGTTPDCISSLHSIRELGKSNNQEFQPSLVVMIDRMEVHSNNPMYPTELSKLIIANAEFPAGKAMFHHAFNNAVIKIFSVQVGLSHIAPGSTDMNVMPATSMVLSVKDCILPETWGNETIKRIEAHLEMPSIIVQVSKPHLLLLSHLVASWAATFSLKKEIPVLSKSALSKMLDEDGHGSVQSYLDVNLTNTDVQCCTTSVIMAATASLGSFSIVIRSKVKDDHIKSTYLVQGPCNTSDIYTGRLFNGSLYQDNHMDNMGPVLSLTVQMPSMVEKQDSSSSVGIPCLPKTSNAFLLHIKGIVICLDPLLYSWIAKKPAESSSSTSIKIDRERKKRNMSLTRTSSIGTPRKRSLSFTRGYGPTTPKKEKSPDDKSSSKLCDTNSQTGNQRFVLETWLFEKLPLITTFAVQVNVQSVTVFTPEKNILYDPQAVSIPQNFALQRANTEFSTIFPSTLVLCLPSLELCSARHNRVSFRPKLPLNLKTSKDPTKPGTLPWTLHAKNMAVYSIHGQPNHKDPDDHDSIYYMVSPVSCTAVLASAQTSSVTSPVKSSLHHSLPRVHKTGSEVHRVPTLGFCVHSDFTPVVVSSSRKQITLIANIVESLLHAVMPSSSNDTIACPPTPGKQAGPALQRTVSVTSSSAIEQVEKEIRSLSESSSSFTDVNQTIQGVRLSLWLQWTLPRLIVKLFGHTSYNSVPICVTSDLEDLTAFMDYQDTHLQMQFKVGAFGVTHSVKKGDSKWHPGPYGGIVFSCQDILSYKTSPLATSTRLPPTGNQQDGSISNPHGFLSITYNCLNLHFKRKHSTSEKTGNDPVPEESFQLQHEVRVAVQPFDFVLWTPAVVAAIDVFDARLLDKFTFLSQGSFLVTPTDSSKEEKNDESAVLSANLLPLLFINMRDIRLFLPYSNLTHGIPDKACPGEDLVVVHLSKVATTPHPDNPISRSVLNKDLHEKYIGFGRSSRRALGYDLHEVQYQTDLTGFGIWAAKWNELCGNLNQHSDVLVIDQNPALEWNTRLWQSANEVNVSLLLSESDFKIVLAPAVTMEMTFPSSKHTKSTPVCGWSVELNAMTNMDFYLNKSQMLLLQNLALENTQIVLSCELLASLNQSKIKMPVHDGDITDSGLGSSQADQTKKHDKHVPFEAFIAARKLSVRVYAQCAKNRRKSLLSREGSPSRSLSMRIKPLLLIDVIEPAVVFKDHALGPGFQLWCYDVMVMGCHLPQGWLHKSLPEASDFNMSCFHTRSGVPDPNTGIKPSLLTIAARRLPNQSVNISLDIGRPIQVSFSLDLVSELAQLFGDVIVQSENTNIPENTKPTSLPVRNTLVLHHIDVTTRGVAVDVTLATVHEECPKLMVSMSENQSVVTMRNGEQGKVPSVNANLKSEGLQVSFVLNDQRYYFIRPLTLKCELEMVSSPNSLTHISSSMPQICSRVDIGLLQIDFGQQHLKFISTVSRVLQEFFATKSEAVDNDNKTTIHPALQDEKSNIKMSDHFQESAQNITSIADDDHGVSIREDACLDFEVVEPEDKHQYNTGIQQGLDGVKQSFDDLRVGPFRYVTISGDASLHHPEPNEIIFTADTRDRPPSMIWRYPEPRALVTVEVLPLPFTSPVLVNTLNMGDELRVPCVLSYWDNLQKCYVVYKEFFISEVSTCNISLPDPLTADPSIIVVAEEWQMIVDASIDVDYPDDYSCNDEDGSSSYSSPYRSLISATSLAASVKVNSLYQPSLIPAVAVQISVSLLEIKLLNHALGSKQALPKYLDGYTLDPSVPTEQEFCHCIIEGLNGVTKHLGGGSGATLINVEWNCHCEVLDFADLTYQPFLCPFDVSLSTVLFHGETRRSVWLESSVDVGDVENVITQSTVHTLAVAVDSWIRSSERQDVSVLFNQYIICNDTNEAIRLGQVDTDEAILLPSRHVLPYSWRITRHVQRGPKLHVCFESEGDWRWSEPFDINSSGACTRVIHHKLHSASIVVHVVQLSGVQLQVIFRGSLQITSRLSVKVDLQVLKNPSLGSVSTEKSTLQVHEDISLSPDTTLPSFVVSHAGLVGMRIRIPGTTTWSEQLPLDHVINADGRQQHLIVKLLGVKTFQTFYLWYSMERTVGDQTQITLSPLFVMRSHLPEPVLMNVMNAKTNTTTKLEVIGRGQEEQLLDLAPNTWHHLTFQVNNQGGTSEPSVPLNSTLIDLVNKMNPEDYDEEDTPLDSLWPYCGYVPRHNGEPKPCGAESTSVVRHVVSGPSKESTNEQNNQENGVPPFPDIELQCRVIKKWNRLSTLLIDVIPWCLLVNKTLTTLYIRDRETNMEMELPSSQTIAPYKFKGQVQLGTYIAGSDTLTWSKPASIHLSQTPRASHSLEPKPRSDQAQHVTISIVHVTKSAQPIGLQLTMTSQLRHGVQVVSFQEKFSIVNSTNKPLMAFAVLAAKGKKVPSEALSGPGTMVLPGNNDTKISILIWNIPSSSSVVLDQEGVASCDDTLTAVYFSLGQHPSIIPSPEHDQHPSIIPSPGYDSTPEPNGTTNEEGSDRPRWSSPFLFTPNVSRHSLSIPDGTSSIPLVVTPKEMSGVTYLVVAIDSTPRLTLYNDCAFTIQFGQTAPPQSPSYQKSSNEKLVVSEQMQPLYDVPEVPAFGMTYYELPVMRDWFKKINEDQKLPDVHVQAMYNVTVSEISEDSEATISYGQATEVPQGWSPGLNINTAGHYDVNLPGRGRVVVFISKSRLCTVVRISPYDENKAQIIPPLGQTPTAQAFQFKFNVSTLDVCLVDARNSLVNPIEVLRSTLHGISIAHIPVSHQSEAPSQSVCELIVKLNALQIDNQLEGFEFPVVVITNDNNAKTRPEPRQHKAASNVKPFAMVQLTYEPTADETPAFMQSILVDFDHATVYLEDKLVYRLLTLAESFLPPLQGNTTVTDLASMETKALMCMSNSVLHPLVIGEFTIQPATVNLTVHGSIKLFVAMDDTSLSFGPFHIRPVFNEGSAFVRNVSYHYLSSVLFKIGWVVGSLDILGSPAGLIRNVSQGFADFFYFPYDGLTRGPGAFVSGMSQGVSSFVRHISTGALTSVTNLASSISRNLDKLSMDEGHIILQEEQRSRRPTHLMTGITHGLGGFGLSLLGAVAGVVDQPIQGIQRANDVREAATGVLTGVGKGLVGVVTKPLGGAMELVSQAGRGILRGTGLSHLPTPLRPVEESIELLSRNSYLKYSWKMLNFKTYQNLLLCLDVTVVTASGHDYSGALLLTSNTLYITNSAIDAVQQTLHVQDTDLQKDESDNRIIAVTSVISNNLPVSINDNLQTGDRERLEQFLRDAHAYARESRKEDTSGDSLFTSNFILIIDPVLRETVLSLFKTVKYNLTTEEP